VVSSVLILLLGFSSLKKPETSLKRTGDTSDIDDDFVDIVLVDPGVPISGVTWGGGGSWSEG